jgi:hypothetical protein
MKKILLLAVISALLIVPSLSSAKNAMTDSELGALYAQSGGTGVLTEGIAVGDAICSGNRCSFNVTFSDVNVKTQNLRSITTDGWNYWSVQQHGIFDFHTFNDERDPNYFGTRPQNHVGFGAYNQPGYVGYTDVTVIGGLVKRSGSLIIELSGPENDPTDLNYSNISSKSSIRAQINSLHVDTGDMAITAIVKLGSTPDLAGNQTLGRVYSSGVAMTTSGALTVYAHNNNL